MENYRKVLGNFEQTNCYDFWNQLTFPSLLVTRGRKFASPWCGVQSTSGHEWISKQIFKVTPLECYIFAYFGKVIFNFKYPHPRLENCKKTPISTWGTLTTHSSRALENTHNTNPLISKTSLKPPPRQNWHAMKVMRDTTLTYIGLIVRHIVLLSSVCNRERCMGVWNNRTVYPSKQKWANQRGERTWVPGNVYPSQRLPSLDSTCQATSSSRFIPL